MGHHPNRPHHHDEKKKHKKEKHTPPKKGLHQDWRTWTVVILMLVAMAAYILTDDEALGPGGQREDAIGAVGE